MTNADNSYWVYQYDSLGQVTSGKKYWSDGTPVAGQQFTYTFDTIGNRTQTQTGGDSTGSNLRVANYTNNTLNQITSRDIPGYVDILGEATNTASVYVNLQSTYRKTNYFRDELAVNNSSSPLWLGVTNLAVLTDNATTDITSTNTGNVFLPQTPETFAYDADGNLTNDGRWSYNWDAENRLTNMTSQSTAPLGSQLLLNFAYDYQGRRVQKTVFTNNGSAYVPEYTNNFAYDGWNLIAVLSPQSSVLQSFEWGLDLCGAVQGGCAVGGLLALNDTLTVSNQPSSHFIAYDANGNPATLVNAVSGLASASYANGPFGEVIRATGPMAKLNPFRFSTIYQDDETDMLMYLHRPYSASQGRFLSREPLGELGANLLYNIGVLDVFGEESRENPYLLVDNDPVHHYDILGLQSVPVSLAEAIASGNVAQVEAILAGMEEGDAGYALAQAFLKKVAACIALHTAYDVLKCPSCKKCVSKEQAIANSACLATEIALRQAYINKKCDYCLAISIARGSALAAAGHEKQVAELTVQLLFCTKQVGTLPSATPPVTPTP